MYKRFFSIVICFALLSPSFVAAQQMKTKEQLEQELKDLEAQIQAVSGTISETQKQGASLSRDISVLDAKIREAKLQIKQREAAVTRLSQGISEKNKSISTLDEKMDREKHSLAQILRKTKYQDNQTLLDFALQNKSLSSFFVDVDAFQTVSGALKQSFEAITYTKNDIMAAKTELEDTKQQELAAKVAQELAKKKVETNQKEKQGLLTVTKGQEKEYQKILSDKQKQAATIRAALFELSGTKAINFGAAYDLAVKVQGITGIRPAFLLGIITEESNLGQNVGKGTWKVDMHPTRDQPIFAQITAELGLDPDQMPVSKKAWYGYGGAMGPAQFIPSTWVLYKDKVGRLTGHVPPNPWNAQDAFTASALLLKDNGAIAGDKSSEQRAAVCYLAGCGNAKKTAYQFYGNDVMALADKYEAQIAILQAK